MEPHASPPKPELVQLGHVIKRVRTRSGAKQKDLASALNVVPSTLSSWESGTRAMSEETARKIDQQLDSPGVVHRAWRGAHEEAAVPSWYPEVEQLEQMITELREYQSQVIPGLIQTEAYARAANRDTSPGVSDGELEKMVKARMRRQLILEDTPPLIYMVLEATAVTRVIGNRRILAGQLERVLRLMEKRVVRLQVVPPNPGTHPGASGPFRVYSFADKPMVASAEYQQGEILMDDSRKVQSCLAVFSAVQAEALSPGQSAEYIRKIKEELDEHTAQTHVAQEQLQHGQRELRRGG
nr:helix-turn-helix transcriptional regulator [Nocardiopsis alba]